MPQGRILPYHALKDPDPASTPKLAGKLSANQRETKRLRLAIFQVGSRHEDAQPGSEPAIDRGPKRRKRRQSLGSSGARFYRAVIDTLRKATGPMTAGRYLQGTTGR